MIKKATKKPLPTRYVTFEDFDNSYNKLKKENNKVYNSSDILGIEVSNDRSVALASINPHVFMIPTLEGEYKFTSDDVLMIGIENEIYPCKIRIFEKTYDIS